jgi:aminoglycoside phosphotransferase (APT) family kinase protein
LRAPQKRPFRITKKHVHGYLRRFAKDISIPDLEMLPHHGSNIVFRYRNDSILKVAKNEQARKELTKEARLLEYLEERNLPVALPKLLQRHRDGYYILMSRIDGNELSEAAVARMPTQRQKTLAESVGGFLSFLHTHDFPEDVIAHIPRCAETLEVLHARDHRKIEFLKEHDPECDTEKWDQQLATFEDALTESWSVSHGDFNIGHVFSVQSDPARFAVIDFNCSLQFDPSVDLAELFPDLPESVQQMILENYSTDDLATIVKKVEFRRFCDRVHGPYRRAKTALKRSETHK